MFLDLEEYASVVYSTWNYIQKKCFMVKAYLLPLG